MTWNHPRGLSPLLAAAARWREQTGTSIEWDARSLQDFETYPLEDLARRYDLIVIDHPHVGQVSETDCLMPLDGLIEEDALAAIAAGSVGGSYESYRWKQRQWALPIDAAAQVQAWVPDRIDGPLLLADDLPDLVAQGRAVVPLRSPHALMTLFTLCGLSGVPLNTSTPELFPAAASVAYDRLAKLTAVSDVSAWSMDPIAVLDDMAAPRSSIAVAPFVYGYVSYSRDDASATLVRFADLPTFGGDPRGSALGGTGLAVSRFGSDPAGAARFAAWYASGAVQRDLVGPACGQPAHDLAWSNAAVNRDAGDFYAATRRTLDLAWLRPRHHGYMSFQDAASEQLEQALRLGKSGERALAALNRLYGECR